MLLFFWDGKSRDEQNVAGDVVHYGNFNILGICRTLIQRKCLRPLGFTLLHALSILYHYVCVFCYTWSVFWNYIHLDPYTIQWMVCFEKDFHLEICPEQRNNQPNFSEATRHHAVSGSLVKGISPFVSELARSWKKSSRLGFVFVGDCLLSTMGKSASNQHLGEFFFELFPGIEDANPRRWFYFSPWSVPSTKHAAMSMFDVFCQNPQRFLFHDFPIGSSVWVRWAVWVDCWRLWRRYLGPMKAWKTNINMFSWWWFPTKICSPRYLGKLSNSMIIFLRFLRMGWTMEGFKALSTMYIPCSAFRDVTFLLFPLRIQCDMIWHFLIADMSETCLPFTHFTPKWLICVLFFNPVFIAWNLYICISYTVFQ